MFNKISGVDVAYIMQELAKMTLILTDITYNLCIAMKDEYFLT